MIPSAKLSGAMKCRTVFGNFPVKINGWYLWNNFLYPVLDGIRTTDQYPSDSITFSADGYTLETNLYIMLDSTQNHNVYF